MSLATLVAPATLTEAVIVAVASGHRDEAFTVCREVIEGIKRELPVWKRQVEADGTTAWKGLGG